MGEEAEQKDSLGAVWYGGSTVVVTGDEKVVEEIKTEGAKKKKTNVKDKLYLIKYRSAGAGPAHPQSPG